VPTDHSTSVVGCCDCSKPFLASSIPAVSHSYILIYVPIVKSLNLRSQDRHKFDEFCVHLPRYYLKERLYRSANQSRSQSVS